jgi:hypothetical protein
VWESTKHTLNKGGLAMLIFECQVFGLFHVGLDLDVDESEVEKVMAKRCFSSDEHLLEVLPMCQVFRDLQHRPWQKG